MTATHWVTRWNLTTGQVVEESTRTAGIQPATEMEMREGLASVLRPNSVTAQRHLEPFAWVNDRRRGGKPTLVFLAQVATLELEEDTEPEEEGRGFTEAEVQELREKGYAPEVQRHLELVLTEDPGPEVPLVNPEGVGRALGGHWS